MQNPRLRILLVEDNPGDARLVREALAEARATEFELVPVERLAEGIRRLDMQHFDAILLDLSLPDAHGLDTFAQAHAHAPNVPIVVLTGLADETLALKAVRQGAQDYLVKGEVDGSRLVRALRYAIERHRRPPEGAVREGLSKIFNVLKRSGLRVSQDRLDDLIKAAAARSRATGRVSINKYFDRLTSGPMADQEFKELVKVLTVGETYFFRTANHMWAFRDDLLPQVAALRQKRIVPGLSGRPITIWSPGCSTGEEPYSLAMLIDENQERFSQHTFRILGTDINEDVLRAARIGTYDDRAVKPLPPRHLKKYLTRKGDRYALSSSIKRMVDFAYHNLLEPSFPPPIGTPNSVDIIFCRNVFIYFADETVNEIANRLFNILTPGGFLVVGHAETLDTSRTGFEMVFLSGAYMYRKPLEPAQARKLAAPPPTREAPQQTKKPEQITEERPPPPHPPASPIDNARTLTEQARLAADRGNYEEALRKAAEAIKLDPRNARAHCVIGLVHWTKGNTQQAVPSFSNAADLDKNFALPRYYLAEAYRRAGQRGKALRSYTEAIKILQRQPPGDPVWGSETVTNAGLAKICQAAVATLKPESPAR